MVAFSSYSFYVPIFLIFSLLLCIIRTIVVWNPEIELPEKEEDAIEFIDILVKVAKQKGELFEYICRPGSSP